MSCTKPLTFLVWFCCELICSLYCDSCEDDSNPMASMVTQPKHSHVPDVPTDSNLIFELIIFGFSVMCLCLQYINLYKTVWWLPHSHANYALVSCDGEIKSRRDRKKHRSHRERKSRKRKLHLTFTD